MLVIIPQDGKLQAQTKIRIKLLNRVDVLSVFINVVKNLFAMDYLPSYSYNEDETKTKIYIYKKYVAESYKYVNKVPAIILEISGTNIEEVSMGHSYTNLTPDDTVVAHRENYFMTFTIIGRTEPETYRIADSLKNMLFIFRDNILESVENLDYIADISVNQVQPFNTNQNDDIRLFFTTINFRTGATYQHHKRNHENLFTLALWEGEAKQEGIIGIDDGKSIKIEQIIIKDVNDD